MEEPKYLAEITPEKARLILATILAVAGQAGAEFLKKEARRAWEIHREAVVKAFEEWADEVLGEGE